MTALLQTRLPIPIGTVAADAAFIVALSVAIIYIYIYTYICTLLGKELLAATNVFIVSS